MPWYVPRLSTGATTGDAALLVRLFAWSAWPWNVAEAFTACLVPEDSKTLRLCFATLCCAPRESPGHKNFACSPCVQVRDVLLS